MSKLPNPRPLTLEDIEFKVDSKPYQRGNQNWARVVAYLRGSRVGVMLNEWVGHTAWKDHYEIEEMPNGTPMIRCYLSVRDPDSGDWVTKEDLGAFSRGFGDEGPSSTNKGGFTDALKRCASRKWGVGHEIYEIAGFPAPVDLDRNGKPRLGDQSLDYIARRVRELNPWLPEGRPVAAADDEDDTRPVDQDEAPAQSAPAEPEPRQAPRPPRPAPRPAEAPQEAETASDTPDPAAMFHRVPRELRRELQAVLASEHSGESKIPLWPMLSTSARGDLGPDVAAQWDQDFCDYVDEWLILKEVVPA